MTANYRPLGSRVSRRSLIRASAVGGVGLAGAALIGCSGKKSSPAAVQKATEPPAAKPANKPTGGVLNVSFLEWTQPPISGLNTHTAVDFFNLALNRIVYVDPVSLKIVPELAESWEQKDPTTLIIKVRKGVKFHNKAPANGREFDAEDMVASFKQNAGLLDDPKNVPLYTRRKTYERVAEYSTPDKYTVQVKFSKPDSTFMEGQGDVLLYAIAKEQWDTGFADATKIAGTGPFILESIQGSHARAKYVKNPNYWEKDEAGAPIPYIDGFNHENIPDRSTWLGAFLANKTDLYTGNFTIPAAERETIRRSAPKASYVKYQPSTSGHYNFHRFDQAPFQDIRVRKAMHLMLDRAKMCNAFFGTEQGDWYYTGPLTSYHPMAIQPDEIAKMPGFNPSSKAADIAEAKKLMAAAGFDGGSGFKFKMPLGAGSGTAYEFAIRVKDQVEQAFPQAKVEVPVLDPTLASGNTRTDPGEIFLTGEQSEVSPVRELYRYWHPQGTRNATVFYKNQAVADNIEKGLVEFDPKARAEIVRNTQMMLIDDVAVIGVATGHNDLFLHPKIKNLAGRQGPALSIPQHTVAQLAKHIWLES